MADVYICDEVKAVESLHKDVFDDSFDVLTICEQLDRQAQQILVGHQERNPAVLTHLRSWFPGGAEKSTWQMSAEEIFGLTFTLADARLTIAREYGFEDWAQVEAKGQIIPDANFEQAVDSVVTGDVDTLNHLLTTMPQLINQHSAHGHRSTLLHYIGANGVETRRQKTPLNAADVTQVLIGAGADVNAEAEMYGGGSTVLGLLISSAHPAEAGVTEAVAQVLKAAGAR